VIGWAMAVLPILLHLTARAGPPVGFAKD
jgi:hypothetical protein